ncbi:MAG: RNA polymerase sigma-70 factor [Prolixibacteraceae bacterium]|jgi:RNA polymerase sigma-70 factor (ECF subfamily)
MTLNRKDKIDEALVKRFANGDMKAFDSIYTVFNSRLQNFIFTLIKTETETEDLVHEVFVKVWENKDKLKSYASFDAYLFTIAYNTTISFLRKKAKSIAYIEYVKSIQAEADEPDFIEGLNREDIDEKINLLIEKMPPRQREVFKMRHFRNSSYKEIALALNISVNTVENHLAKAHKYLKEDLGKNYLPVLLVIHLFF